MYGEWGAGVNAAMSAMYGVFDLRVFTRVCVCRVCVQLVQGVGSVH